MTKLTTSFGTELDILTNDKQYEIPSLTLDIEAKTSGTTSFSFAHFPKFKNAKNVRCEILGIVTNVDSWNNPVELVPLGYITGQVFTTQVITSMDDTVSLNIIGSNDSPDKPTTMCLRVKLTQPLQEIK